MNNNLTDKILVTALELAESDSWETLHLYTIAQRLEIDLDQIRHYYPQKDDIVEAWFDCADEAMLQACETQGFGQISTPEKLHLLIMTWLSVLHPHRHVTRQMIAGKLEPGHIHYQVQGLLRVSRTVQWLREAAGISSTLPWRALEESALTAIYVATFTKWMFDDSEGSQSTSRFLEVSLNAACRGYPCNDTMRIPS